MVQHSGEAERPRHQHSAEKSGVAVQPRFTPLRCFNFEAGIDSELSAGKPLRISSLYQLRCTRMTKLQDHPIAT
jgi:hypothetical protein